MSNILFHDIINLQNEVKQIIYYRRKNSSYWSVGDIWHQLEQHQGDKETNSIKSTGTSLHLVDIYKRFNKGMARCS